MDLLFLGPFVTLLTLGGLALYFAPAHHFIIALVLAFWVSLALFSLLVALSAARDGVNAIQSWRASRR